VPADQNSCPRGKSTLVAREKRESTRLGRPVQGAIETGEGHRNAERGL